MRHNHPLHSRLLTLSAPLLLTLPALAQDAVPLVMQGDTIPGIGDVQILLRVWVNSRGDWLAEVDTDAPAGTDNVLLLNGTPILREGDPVSDPGGTVRTIDDVDLNELGQVMVNHTLLGSPSGATNDHAVYIDGSLVALEGDAVTAPQVTPGTTFVSFEAVDITDAGSALLRGAYDDPAVQGSADEFIMRVGLDTNGSITSQEVLAVESQIAPGTSRTINFIRRRHVEAALGSCGDVLWGADLDGDVADDAIVYFNDTLIAREGTLTDVGTTWGELDDYVSDVNDAGDWLLSDRLADNTRSIVINGETRVEEGDVLPATEPFPIDSVGAAHAELDDAGRVLWHGDWNDGANSVGLFVDNELVVQRGVTRVGGAPIQGLANGPQVFTTSANGRFIVFRGSVSGGGDGFFLMDRALGSPYCSSGANSTGFASTIHASGSLSITSDNLTLIADNLPAGQAGLFYLGPRQLQAPFGNGVRCVGGPNVHRLRTQLASKGGLLAQQVDYQAPELAGDLVSGSTWNFQAWFRDTQSGGAGFDLSNAVSLTFQP